jgi:hypothetical protein
MTFVEYLLPDSPFRLRGIVLGKCDDATCTNCDEGQWGFAIAGMDDDLWAFIGDAARPGEDIAWTIADEVLKDVEWFARVPYLVGCEWALLEEFPRRAYIVQTAPLGADRSAFARRASVPELREAHYAAVKLAGAGPRPVHAGRRVGQLMAERLDTFPPPRRGTANTRGTCGRTAPSGGSGRASTSTARCAISRRCATRPKTVSAGPSRLAGSGPASGAASSSSSFRRLVD